MSSLVDVVCSMPITEFIAKKTSPLTSLQQVAVWLKQWPDQEMLLTATSERFLSLQTYIMKTVRNNLPVCTLHWKEWIFAGTGYPLSPQTPPPQICDIAKKQKKDK